MQKYNIIAAENEIKIEFIDGNEQVFQRQKFPDNFLKWQSESRMKMFDMLQNSGENAVKTMPGHLPVLATFNKDALFINLSTRGMGVIPKKSLLAEITKLFEDVKNKTEGKSVQQSLKERVLAVKDFYADEKNFDESIIGGLEIFEGQTAKNIENSPLASILYSAGAPLFTSYQFNGIMEMIFADNEHYKFLLAARELFAQDAFHIHQIHYPFGYIFHLSEIKNKTPFSRK